MFSFAFGCRAAGVQPPDPGSDSQFPAIETTVHHYSSVLLTAEGMSLYSNNQFFNDMLRPRVTHYTHLLGSQVDKSEVPKSEVHLRIRDQEGWASLSFFLDMLVDLFIRAFVLSFPQLTQVKKHS